MSVEISGRLFEWDSEKALSNVKKHGVSFENAALVFNDNNRIETFDIEHSIEEERWLTIGKVNAVLCVIYTERKDVTRLISARKATSREKRMYYAGQKVY